MAIEKKVMLSTDDMREMFDIMIHSDDKFISITIPIEHLSILYKWKQKGIDISFEELIMLVNLGSFDAEIEDETTKDRRWRLFKKNMQQYYEDTNGIEKDAE
jgi:hypothetical protein